MAEDNKHIAEEINVTAIVVDWCNRFEPCTEENADLIFPIGRLRDEFAAWGYQPGYDTDDPLAPYLKSLEQNGFRVQQTFGSGPAILCKFKRQN